MASSREHNAFEQFIKNPKNLPELDVFEGKPLPIKDSDTQYIDDLIRKKHLTIDPRSREALICIRKRARDLEKSLQKPDSLLRRQIREDGFFLLLSHLSNKRRDLLFSAFVLGIVFSEERPE